MGILCRKWIGQTGRARPPAQPPGSGPTAGQSITLLWRRSLGQAGSSRWSCQFLSGRTFVAAQPTASSMETARPLSHKVPLAVHCSLPADWPERRACVQELRVQGSAMERGIFRARMCPDGLRGYLLITHHQPSASGPSPHLRPLLHLQMALPLLCPSLLSALVPRSTLLALGQAHGLPEPFWT